MRLWLHTTRPRILVRLCCLYISSLSLGIETVHSHHLRNKTKEAGIPAKPSVTLHCVFYCLVWYVSLTHVRSKIKPKQLFFKSYNYVKFDSHPFCLPAKASLLWWNTAVFKSYNYVKFNSHLFYQPVKGQRPLVKHILRRLVPLKEGGSGVAILRKWSRKKCTQLKSKQVFVMLTAFKNNLLVKMNREYN